MKRRRNKQLRKLSATVLAVSLLMSSTAYADTIIPSSTTPSAAAAAGLVLSFSDVTAQHWAIKHVTKLASLGIIQGYERNEYRPENSVSQQEVIVMALRMMGLENEVKRSRTETVLPFAVDDFFKPYVAYAFDKGLITVQEETQGTTTKTAWGSREATREWVAKLVIRAIGKQALANQLSSAQTSFSDGQEFSSWGGGYINAAASLKIVQGFEDNSFQPKGKVTRAQMATFLSRADAHMTTRSERVTIGYVMERTDNKLVVQNAIGEQYDFSLSADTVFYSGKDDSRIPSTNLKITNEVYVVSYGNNALYIEQTNDQEKLEVFEGTLNEVFVNQMVLSLQQANGKNLFELDGKVTVTDAEGRGLSLGSIVPGSIVELKRNPLVKSTKITQVVVKQAPVSKVAEGTVVSVNREQNQITFLEATGNQNETYPISARVFVTLPDGSAAELSKLRVGDFVSYDVKANELASVTVRKQADVTVSTQGKLVSINHDSRILTVTDSSSKLGSYYLADNAIVEIEGLTNPSFYDIEVNDDLRLDILNNKVVKATVTSRSVAPYVFASILSYDPDTKALMISTDNGSIAAYRLTDSTIIKYGESTLPLSNFQSMFTKGKRVDLKVSKDKVVSIQYTLALEGTVSLINAGATTATQGEITIRTASGQSIVMKTNYSIAVDSQSKANGTLADLKVGDNVKATLSYGQDYVTAIAVKRVGVYKTIMTNASSRQVTVKDETGANHIVVVDTDDKIVNPGKATHAFSDIAVDEYVKVSYDGSKLDKVVLMSTTRGKVTAVDAAAGTITVQDFANGVQVVPVGQQYIIKQNGTTTAALTNIKVNDRVEIAKDANDKVTIYVATAMKRTIQSYDVVLNTLFLKPANGVTQNSFNFFSKAYLHKGTQQVAANAFMENEEVTIYLIDNKIVEIEK
ncbi:S-layer homology domain-containing protein [Paenibacillus silviterrae]|uniref:S-layer homology domain-containing protein n=1 Tax=Paenibacillus silviterrae TaxID=3242194 RepID=UPI00254363B7|nr:S-layer homology domain-containing protein [Paenibacillus chinjuensis]